MEASISSRKEEKEEEARSNIEMPAKLKEGLHLTNRHKAQVTRQLWLQYHQASSVWVTVALGKSRNF